MKVIQPFWLLFGLLLFVSCIDKKDSEAEMPAIELISPLPCDTLYFGENTRFIVNISDNVGLGNLSMDIHHNFGHHSHGDHESCNMDEVKDPVIPFDETWLFSLPESEQEFVLDTLLTFPDTNNLGQQYDPGDYHFHIYITDSEGYLTFTTMDVKVLYHD